MIIALYAIEGIFYYSSPLAGLLQKMNLLLLYTQQKEIFPTHHLWRSASENEYTIALYAIEEKFPDSSPLTGCFRK
ncbi:MAG: hypothetical protein F6K40_06630 [Okeania sp. SIO3I5]|uniref:hypothetical protein n=1 Tax=Okeania sp. SIO3I5 TaxID=2607805 RepID=UPI0013BBAB5F|nr:hypothetical protein [Okeania sp. SIO3I5]NEQ35976.1 hypothetical protein [Okeania sp. SIO3I5]